MIHREIGRRALTMTAAVLAVLTITSVAASSAWAAVGHTAGIASVSQTGAATYSIPLWTPPGINGIQPTLALQYSSRVGDGYFGMGWSLSGLSSINRCRKTWAQDGTGREVRNDASDRFCLDGNQLKLVAGTYGADSAEYRTELESFARIRSYGAAGNGPAYFIVERKDGLIYEYGNTGDSRILSVGQSTARAWAVNKIRDRAGNAVLFSYTVDSTNGSYYISNIQYTQNTAAGVSPHYQVTFSYQGLPSGEVDSTYLANSPINRTVRANQIDVTNDGSLVHRYVLNYEANLSPTLKSRLSSVQECAGTTPDCLPATTFSYQSGTAGLNAEANSPITSMPANIVPMIMDVNGDGLKDLVYVSNATSGAGVWMVALANASGGYNSPITTSISNTNWTGAIVIDYNADGLQDLLVPYSGGTWWVMLGTSSGFATPSDTGIPVTATGTGNNARAIDIDGDGYEDLVWADLVGAAGGDAIRYRLRDPQGTFSSTVYTLVGPMPADEWIMSAFGKTSGQPQPTRVPDFNGDGRGDVVYVQADRTFNDGTGKWIYHYNAEVVCPGGASFGAPAATGGSIYLIYFGDFNGDGLTDLMYTSGSNGWVVVRYSTGTSFTSEVVVTGSSSYNAFYILDWDGDGYDDVLFANPSTGTVDMFRSTGLAFASAVATGLPSPSSLSNGYAVTDIDGNGLWDLGYGVGGVWKYRTHAGSFPDLLLTATDGFGNAVSFNYVPITQGAYTKGTGTTVAAYPERDYQGPLYVVNSFTGPTGIQSPSTYTQTFWYYGARLNLQGRGFEGFSEKRTNDSRNGLYAYQYYNQAFPYTGSLAETDLYQPNNTTLMARAVNTPADSTAGSSYETRHFPYTSQTTATRYELGGNYNGSLVSTTVTTNAFDGTTGALTDTTSTVTEASSANGVQPGGAYVHRTYVQTQFSDFTNWCIGRTQAVQQINSHNLYGGGQLTRQTNSTWDGSYCRPTQFVAQPGDASWQVTTDLHYDGFGNVDSQTVTGAGMAPRTTATSWGTRGQFPVTITNALSQQSQKGWDYGLGLQTSETDPNGISTSWQYDVFGRRTRESRPDGTYTIWSYYDCPNWGGCLIGSHGLAIAHYLYNADGSVQTDGTTYLDALDRQLIDNKRLLAAGTYDRNEVRYDSLGRTVQVAAPCTWSAVSTVCPYWTSYVYDATNRVTQSSRLISDSNPTVETTSTYYEGLTVRTVDPQAKQSAQVFNAAGALARSVDHNGYYVAFDYDPFGDLIRTTDSLGSTLQSISYNIVGMKVGQTDIDMGAWSFTPDALGELVSQTDAKGQAISFVYDALGRMTSRTELEGTSTWTWGNSQASRNIGRLASAAAESGYSEAYIYDSLGRLSSKQIGANGTYQYDLLYNANTGLLDTLTYPTSTSSYRLKLQYSYQNGILQQVSDYNAPSTVFWQANATNPRGQILQETLGNGVVTNRSFDAVTGWLSSVQSGLNSGAALQNESYLYDGVGNLTQRQNNNVGLTENFYYDNLYRLEHSTLGGATNLALTYDATGNIASRTDVAGGAAWTYDPAKKHAVTQSGTGGYSYTYDANGNVTARNGYSVNWTSYNHPSVINGAGNESVQFAYDQNYERWRAIYSGGGGTETTYFVGDLMEAVVSVGVTDYRHYIYAGGAKVAVLSRTTTGTNTLRYIREDHQGSISAILTDTGAAYVKESFTAFGNRRSACTWSGSPTAGNLSLINAATRRGYTWQTALGAMGLNDMHGRIQDAVAGRFLSADPYISQPSFTQSYNRYTYAFNNPLTYTDPSGYTNINRENGGEHEQNAMDARELADVRATSGFAEFLALSDAMWGGGGIDFTVDLRGNGGATFFAPDLLQMRGFRTAPMAFNLGALSSAPLQIYNYTPEQRKFEFSDGSSDSDEHWGVDVYSAHTYLGRYNPDTREFDSAWSDWTISKSMLGNLNAQFGGFGAGVAAAWNTGLKEFRNGAIMGAATEIAATGLAAGLAATAARGTTSLFRAVGPAELADIQATGALRSIAGLEGKYFTTSAEAAASYARQAVRAFGDPPYTLIRTEVPNSIFRGLTPATVDGGIPAWVIPNSRLPGLSPQVLDVMPIPGL